MPVGRYVYRMPHTVPESETVRTAAQLMERESVGCVVLVEDGRPVGMLTDRDIALRILGHKLDPSVVSVGELARRPPIVVSAQASLAEAVRVMRLQRVRWLLVVDPVGKLMGVLCVDDVLRAHSSEVAQLGEALRTQLSGPAAREPEHPR
ncbi:MAG TPA: CBS domain-containing protein [Deltaproteobacteria bacterium]|jgi:CBS domain-containing protein|nr:CBS domain-containing protein [Deltaproteobacteria bacterium]